MGAGARSRGGGGARRAALIASLTLLALGTWLGPALAEEMGALDSDPPAVVPPPTLSVEGPSEPVPEGGPAQFTVTLTGASAESVTVKASTAVVAGGADSADFTSVSDQEIIFAPGETGPKTVEVATTGDDVDEDDEKFSLALSNPTGGATIDSDKGSAEATIADDDAPPVLSVSGPSAAVTEGGDATFTVTKTGASENPVKVNASTAAGTAGSGDFTAVNDREITFAPGATGPETVRVATTSDSIDEADETFQLSLSAPSEATVASGGGSAEATIADDDAAPTLSVSGPSGTVSEGGEATFTVTKSGDTERTVTVRASTVAGSADENDFTAVTDRELTFAPGETSRTVSVPIRDDSDDEPEQSFSLRLAGEVNARVSGGAAGARIAASDTRPAPPADLEPEPAGQQPATPLAPVDPAPRETTRKLSNERTLTRWAYVDRATVARREPDSKAKPIKRFSIWTGDGTPELTVALYERRLASGAVWVKVRLPMRPNGRTGWVPRSALGPYRLTTDLLRINRRAFRATLYRKGRKIWSSRVGVGKRGTWTPGGTFYVRERLVPPTKNTIYGVFAFGFSAYSPTLTDWPGGGIIGMHGTNQPSLIPGRISNGCIRVRNGNISRLRRLMSLGTPVVIR